ncbi:capsular biosynthesis protein [Polynucleobacter paneuropaeus]|nr:capsular biosynthesis protein [Polynucleobacter paneuropaeus]
MKRLILDLDNTICKASDGNYQDALVIPGMIDRLKEYQSEGFQIIFYTSRNIRTFEGNIGKITAFTLPVIVDWLNKNSIPYDEIYIGKPWCGEEGFYVDDRAIRPSEFLSLNRQEIINLLRIEE